MKRHSSNKDMIKDNFGRQVRLLTELAGLGWQIKIMAADYKNGSKEALRLNGMDVVIVPFNLFRAHRYYASADNELRDGNYDAVIGATDPIFGILAYRLSRKHKVPMLYDLQDNFETYGSSKIPFVRALEKKAIKNCEWVMCVSISLMKKISKIRSKKTFVVQNGIELGLFRPMEKKQCRKALGLPENGKIIAYVGHISKGKGVDLLMQAFEKIRKEIPNTYLLLSGKQDLDIRKNGIIFNPLPEREMVVTALNAADVNVIPNPENEFTKYCFPYKLLEYMACNTQLVATDVGDTGTILGNNSDSLVRPGSAEELKEKILANLNKGKINYRKEIKAYTWKNLALKIDKELKNEPKN